MHAAIWLSVRHWFTSGLTWNKALRFSSYSPAAYSCANCYAIAMALYGCAFLVMLWCCVVWRSSRAKCKKDTIIVSESERNTLKRTLTACRWRQPKPKWKEKWQNNAACRKKSLSLCKIHIDAGEQFYEQLPESTLTFQCNVLPQFKSPDHIELLYTGVAI